MSVPSIIAVQIKEENLNKYHNINCCDLTLGIDILLSSYKQDRDNILALLDTNPEVLIKTLWKPNGPLGIDNSCLCRMGKGNKRSPFTCAQCKNMRRLIDFRVNTIDTPFKIECGNMTGKSLIINNISPISPHIEWNEEAVMRSHLYTQQYKNLSLCGSGLTVAKALSGDMFTMRTLITWIIMERFQSKGLPHIPTLYTAFMCNNEGYTLSDVSTIGMFSNLEAITPVIARGIILQLLVILTELSTMNFCHGNPSIKGLIFNKFPVSYKYNGVNVQSPITLQITDLWNSSISRKNIHYFPVNVKLSSYIQNNMFIPEIVTRPDCHPKNTCSNGADNTLYKLTTSTLNIYTAIRHMGFPLYVGSFDLYCFMVSLMSEKSFCDVVYADDELYHLWEMMWLPEDLIHVEKYIQENHAGMKHNSVDIIRGSWLRCDILSYLWSLIKK